LITIFACVFLIKNKMIIKYWYTYIHHCLKVFGLLALKTFLYLVWLALLGALRIGNLMPFSLNKWDLGLRISSFVFRTTVLMIEIVSGEALWLPAISWCNWLTAPLRDKSLYSLYMLWTPVRDWYLRTIPKVLTLFGLRSKISLTERIWPCALLVLRSLLKWYQNLDLAMTLFLAKSLKA
jgi:hypothetical protein